MRLKLDLRVECDIDQIVDAIADLPIDSAIKLIKLIDSERADWDFTKKLHAYFSEEMAKEAKHD